MSSLLWMKTALALALLFALSTGLSSADSPARPLSAQIDGPSSIDATGHGSVQLRVHLADDAAVPIPSATAVRAVIRNGDARLSAGLSADLTTDATGSVSFPVYPGTQAGPLTIRFDAGDASVDITYTLTADIRAPLVVGYATGGIGPVPGWVEAPDSAPDGNTARRGAISVFGTGKVANKTRGTFAYDSTNTLEQTLAADPFLDNPNDRPFPIYGDAAVRHDDALSTNHFFGDVQNGESSTMWGQFYAQAGPPTAVGGYDVLVNGAKVFAGGNAVGVGAFTARNATAYARAVISPTGLAIASQALHPDIVIGSDVLTLVHLDRRTGAIVSQTALARGNDYGIDYASGLLRLMNIILPYDDAFNPQLIVVQYEYGGAGAVTTMLGGKAGAGIGKNAHADTWYLNDSVGSGNVTLLGESLSGKTASAAWSVSHERSNGFVPIASAQYGAGGDAYDAALTARAGALHVTLAFARADAAYDNPFGSYTAPGLLSLNGLASIALGRISTLDLSYQYARNALPRSLASEAVNNSDEGAGVTLRVVPSKRLKYHVGVSHDVAASNGANNPLPIAADGTQAPAAPGDYGNFGSFAPPFTTVSVNAGSGHAITADAGFDWKFTQRASIGVDRIQPLGSSTDPYDPPQTQATIALDVGARGKAFIRQLWQQTSSQALAASQAGATYASTAQSQTSIGFEQQAGAATLQTGYAVEHTASGTDLFDAIGVRSRIFASPRLKADGFFQLGNSLFATYGSRDASPFFMTAGTSLDYSQNTFHASGQVQIRTGFDAGSTLRLGAAGPISPAVSLYGSYTAAFTEGVYDTEGRGGLAYRPSRNDRYVTLLSADVYKSNLTNYNAYVTNVLELQELYRSSTRTEWAASAAYKLTGDSFFAPRTTIWGMRADQRIGGRFDIGSELHLSDIAPLGGAHATGFAVEAGYRLGSTLRLAAGYNFSGFANPDTAINPTHRGLYVTLSTYIDRIFGWGKDDRK